MPTIKVPDRKSSQPYWPEELRNEGYLGTLNIYTGVCSLVIPKPNASNKDVAKDLKLLSQQFEYKAEIMERAPKDE